MYKDQSYEEIKNRMMENMGIRIDKREGSFINNMCSGIAMEQAKSHMKMDDILSLGFIRTGFNDYLEWRTEESGIHRKLGKKATGSVKVTGKDGTLLNNGTIFLCGDLTYIMLNDVVINEDDNICYLEALEVGEKYNALPNSNFKLQNDISGIESIINDVEFSGGIDIESDEALRRRYDEYMDDPPTSGNEAQFKIWALEVDGVDRAVVYPRWDKSNGKNGRGTVKVMIVAKDNKPVTEDILNDCIARIEPEIEINDIILTVVTPTLLDVTIKADVNLNDGYDITDINIEFESALNDYIKDIRTEFVYSKVYGLMASLQGVDDVASLTINDATENIIIPSDKIINISNITLSEVI